MNSYSRNPRPQPTSRIRAFGRGEYVSTSCSRHDGPAAVVLVPAVAVTPVAVPVVAVEPAGDLGAVDLLVGHPADVVAGGPAVELVHDVQQAAHPIPHADSPDAAAATEQFLHESTIASAEMPYRRIMPAWSP